MPGVNQPGKPRSTTLAEALHYLDYGVPTAASSVYSTGFDHTFAIDGIDNTGSSWCTANNDPSPSITVTLPASTTLMSLAILTSYRPSYDFLTGRFIARNAANATVYDSGVVALTAGKISHNVTPNIANVRSVQFIGLTWNSIEPCLSELRVFGPLP